MTLEELEQFVLDLQIDKNFAILRGRVDFLDENLQEQWYRISNTNRATTLVVTEYDIRKKNTNPISKRASKVVPGVSSDRGNFFTTDTATHYASRGEVAVFEESNDTGIYPTREAYNYSPATMDSKNFHIYPVGVHANNLIHSGRIPTFKGAQVIIVRQKV